MPLLDCRGEEWVNDRITDLHYLYRSHFDPAFSSYLINNNSEDNRQTRQIDESFCDVYIPDVTLQDIYDLRQVELFKTLREVSYDRLLDLEDPEFQHIKIRRFLQHSTLACHYVEVLEEFADKFDCSNERALSAMLDNKDEELNKLKKVYMRRIWIMQGRINSYEIYTNGLLIEHLGEIQKTEGRDFSIET